MYGWEQLIFLPARPWSSIKHTLFSLYKTWEGTIVRVTWSSSSRWSWAEASALSASSSSHTMSVTTGPLDRDPLSSTSRKLSVVVSFSKPCNKATMVCLILWESFLASGAWKIFYHNTAKYPLNRNGLKVSFPTKQRRSFSFRVTSLKFQGIICIRITMERSHVEGISIPSASILLPKAG